MPVAPQYAAQSRDIELVPMDVAEMPKKPFSAHVLAVFDANNISIRQCSLVRAHCNNTFFSRQFHSIIKKAQIMRPIF